MSNRFENALETFQTLLNAYNRETRGRLEVALIGGFALAAWGVVRATQDIDFLLKGSG